jgi:hypothetical protein
MKKLIDTNFKSFAFKGVLIISLSFFLYIYFQIPNFHIFKLIITKKTLQKN